MGLKALNSTNGTIQISYSNSRKDSLTPSDIFYTRQVIYPVLVTVYNTLECLDMDILPLTSTGLQSIGLDMMTQTEEWRSQLETLSGDGWCIFTVNVRNTYGIPFEVTFKHNKDGMSFHGLFCMYSELLARCSEYSH
jgi:hypothetical protein